MEGKVRRVGPSRTVLRFHLSRLVVGADSGRRLPELTRRVAHDEIGWSGRRNVGCGKKRINRTLRLPFPRPKKNT